MSLLRELLISLRAFRARTSITPAPSSLDVAPVEVAGATKGPRIVGVCASCGGAVLFNTNELATACPCGVSDVDLKDARR